jgi:hypothetical protein
MLDCWSLASLFILVTNKATNKAGAQKFAHNNFVKLEPLADFIKLFQHSLHCY